MRHRKSSSGLLLWFVRHGQSQFNAGERTSDPAQIALTPLGQKQAAHIALGFEGIPDLIVASPYLRAQQTAEPIRQRFSSAASEAWPVQEFTYLDSSRCVNTSPSDRLPMVEEYWQRNDPYHVDGEKAESYAKLIGRADEMWERLAEECEGKWVVMVSHGGFIQAAIWSKLYSGQKVSAEGMNHFRHFMLGMPMANGAILKVGDDGEWWCGPVQTANTLTDAG